MDETHKQYSRNYRLRHRHPCIDCGKLIKRESTRCIPCNNKWVRETGRNHPRPLTGRDSPSWKGGRWIGNDGYVRVMLQPDDFFYSMAFNNPNQAGRYILEHRLIVAKALGRCLHPWEIVHHKGVKYPKGSIENKQDNRYPENLQIIVTGSNSNVHSGKIICPYCQQEFRVR